MLTAQIERKEALYGEFIAECTRLAIDAIDHSLDDPKKLFDVYSLQNRIRLGSSDAVVLASETTIRDILSQYFSPNVKLEELRELLVTNHAGTGPPPDPLKNFSAVCRHELDALRNAA